MGHQVEPADDVVGEVVRIDGAVGLLVPVHRVVAEAETAMLVERLMNEREVIGGRHLELGGDTPDGEGPVHVVDEA